MKKMVNKYFDQSYASVVSMFVKEEKISIEEIQELIQQVLNNKQKKDE